VLTELRTEAQYVIDIVVRNLYERIAASFDTLGG
jgi:hypothetical protein